MLSERSRSEGKSVAIVGAGLVGIVLLEALALNSRSGRLLVFGHSKPKGLFRHSL